MVFGRLKFKDQTNGHIKSFTLKAMLDYLNYFGFNVVEIRGVEADGLSGFLTKIDKVFSRIPSLASHMFIVAENS